jgi:hypothetical protein
MKRPMKTVTRVYRHRLIGAGSYGPTTLAEAQRWHAKNYEPRSCFDESPRFDAIIETCLRTEWSSGAVCFTPWRPWRAKT